jgi:hypothetical protein
MYQAGDKEYSTSRADEVSGRAQHIFISLIQSVQLTTKNIPPSNTMSEAQITEYFAHK